MMKSSSDRLTSWLIWATFVGQVLAAVLMFVARSHAQTPGTESADVTVNSRATWHFQVRARDAEGRRSGPSNSVPVYCSTAPCTYRLLWDSNPASDNVTAYVLEWGTVYGQPTMALTVLPQSGPVPGQLPTPGLRIRRIQ
jgi:hypothetical protein